METTQQIPESEMLDIAQRAFQLARNIKVLSSNLPIAPEGIRLDGLSLVVPDLDTITGAGTIDANNGISSVQTLKLSSVLGPKVVAIATSHASRPRAIRILPTRGTLLRGSNACQRPPIQASNHAAVKLLFQAAHPDYAYAVHCGNREITNAKDRKNAGSHDEKKGGARGVACGHYPDAAAVCAGGRATRSWRPGTGPKPAPGSAGFQND